MLLTCGLLSCRELALIAMLHLQCLDGLKAARSKACAGACTGRGHLDNTVGEVSIRAGRTFKIVLVLRGYEVIGVGRREGEKEAAEDVRCAGFLFAAVL